MVHYDWEVSILKCFESLGRGGLICSGCTSVSPILYSLRPSIIRSNSVCLPTTIR